MITVRFPSGFSVQYNDATCADRTDGLVRLLTKKDGELVAYAPIHAVIEWRPPCRMYLANQEPDELSLLSLEKKVAALTRAINKLQKAGTQ